MHLTIWWYKNICLWWHVFEIVMYIIYFFKLPTPWKEVLLSRPVWMNILAQWGNIWGLFTLMTQAPTYFKYIHGWDITMVSNSIFICLPRIDYKSVYICDRFPSLLPGWKWKLILVRFFCHSIYIRLSHSFKWRSTRKLLHFIVGII